MISFLGVLLRVHRWKLLTIRLTLGKAQSSPVSFLIVSGGKEEKDKSGRGVGGGNAVEDVLPAGGLLRSIVDCDGSDEKGRSIAKEHAQRAEEGDEGGHVLGGHVHDYAAAASDGRSEGGYGRGDEQEKEATGTAAHLCQQDHAQEDAYRSCRRMGLEGYTIIKAHPLTNSLKELSRACPTKEASVNDAVCGNSGDDKGEEHDCIEGGRPKGRLTDVQSEDCDHVLRKFAMKSALKEGPRELCKDGRQYGW